jgi:hypothetical protein
MTRCDVDQHEGCLKWKKEGFARTGGSEGPIVARDGKILGIEKWGIGVAIEYRHWECPACLKTWTTTLKDSTKW